MPENPDRVPRPSAGRGTRQCSGRLVRLAAALSLLFAARVILSRPISSATAGTTNTAYLPIILTPPRPIYLPQILLHWPPLPVDVWVNRVEIIQGITMGDGYTVHVANRPALLRAFIGLSGQPQQAGVTARLTRYVGGVPQDSLEAGPLTVLPTTDEGALGQTLNFSLPNHWLAHGTSYVLELDQANAIFETNESNNRFPGGGQESFDFSNAPVLDVVVVPVRYARPGAPVSLPSTSDLSYLTWMPFKVFPVSAINYTVRGNVLEFTGDLRATQGWIDLLNAVTAVHAVEDLVEHKTYYGLVDSVIVDGCGGGCIAGIGWVNNPPPGGYGSKSAVGFAGFPSNRNEASPTFTHEMGHNFGRRHAPCGTSSGLGPYPYGAGAPIGQWGYDPATGQLYHPTNYRDFMSYCSPEWTSDFTYRALFDAWSWVSAPYGQAVAGASEKPVLVVTGYFDSEGAPVVSNIVPAKSPMPPLTSAGPYRIDLTGVAGRVLASQAFDAVPIIVDYVGPDGEGGHGEDHLGFQVTLPLDVNADSLQITGPAHTSVQFNLADLHFITGP